MREIDVRCAVCGTLGRKAVLTSTSSFGPPDLDLRPQGPARWALEFEVQRCDSCGYCSGSIGQAPPQARAVVESVVYREVLQRSRLPKLARSLFCAALVSEAAGEPDASGWWFLEAAWACDDKNARGQARICRERAAEMFGRALETGETERPAPVMHTLIAEVWRRAGRFDEALEACAAVKAELGHEPAETDDDERIGTATVAAFVRSLVIAGDDDARSCAEAFADDE
jgi:Uncharacterized protein conserved in bacteria (DUF2225)